MPGLFWKPHSAQTLAAVPSAPLAAAALAAAKAVPQARQNWASSLFSVPHTEQSLLIVRPPPLFRWSKDDTLLYRASQFGPTLWRWTMRQLCRAARVFCALCVPEGVSSARRRRVDRRHGVHAVLPATGG